MKATHTVSFLKKNPKLVSCLFYKNSLFNTHKNTFWSICFLFCFIVLTGFKTKPVSECDLLHEGTFIYQFENKEVKVVIHKDMHTEYHEDGKYMIQSRLFWINDCEFVATCVKNTYPNPAYGINDQMHVKVDRVLGNEIYFTSSINRFEWTGKMLKVK
ncbi:hypothetical protein [Flavobacterium sp. J27]|uniref:hypothetical protein n=1 Tax=Flavobacterium sp. J27 TaxID=2060419 RepID=UPI00102FD754|nr:hypothetical protein [Flavobacterium sp. J27]